jgi:outer membrane usher protein
MSFISINHPKLSKLNAITLIIIGGSTFGAFASDWFNPAFLSKDGRAVADLSRFENGSGQAPGVYRVDIWVNDEFVTTSNVEFREKNEGSKADSLSHKSIDETGLNPCLTFKTIKSFGLDVQAIVDNNPNIDNSQCVDYEKYFPGSVATFDFSAQRLFLTFPQAALQNSARGYISPEEWDEGINAGLLSYNLSEIRSNDENSKYLYLNDGVNLGAWRFRHIGALSYVDYKNGYKRKQWQNISTYVQRTVTPLKSEVTIGDSNSESGVFDSIGFQGIRLYSAESMYPDSQQGYAPTVRGIAQGRSTVTVRQNGYVIYKNVVQAGAFEIKDLNPTTSSGDLDVEIKSDSGNIQNITVPYSTVPLLQREGHLKYQIVAGRYRSGSSNKSAPILMQGNFARGISSGMTVYGGIQTSKNYHSAALGMGRNLGNFGAVSADLTIAKSQLADGSNNAGQSLRFLYAKSLNSMGTNFQLLGYRYSTKGFYTFDEVAWDNMRGYQYSWTNDDDLGYQSKPVSYHDLYRSKKGRLQVNLSQQLGSFGSIYLSGNQQTYWNTSGADRWIQAGFSSSWDNINYNLSVSTSKSYGLPGTNRQVSLNVSIPFGLWLSQGRSDRQALSSLYSSSMMTKNQDGVTVLQTGLSGTLLDNNVGYSFMQGRNSESGDSSNLNTRWNNSYNTVNIGYSRSKDYKSLNWGVAGGVVAHADGITFGQTLGDTNVLIKAPGAKNVKIENQTGVNTDWRGYAIVPYATVYRRNRVALDVNSLDSHTDLEDNVQNVVPTEGAIVRATYKAHTGIRVLFTLKNGNALVPFGAIGTEDTSNSTGIVNEDGNIYFTGIPLNGVLHINWGGGSNEQCQVKYSLPKESLNLPIVQKIIECRGN